jgi:hypothetical protein
MIAIYSYDNKLSKLVHDMQESTANQGYAGPWRFVRMLLSRRNQAGRAQNRESGGVARKASLHNDFHALGCRSDPGKVIAGFFDHTVNAAIIMLGIVVIEH